MGLNAVVQLGRLPSDLILEIAKFLPKPAKRNFIQACKRFYDLFKKTLTIHSDISFGFSNLTKVKVTICVKNLELPPSVRTLILSESPWCSITHLTMLNTLKLPCVNERTLSSLSQLTNLRKLELNDSCRPVLSKLTQLTALGVQVETRKCFDIISRLQLKELKILRGPLNPHCYTPINVESLKICELKMTHSFPLCEYVQSILARMGHEAVKRINAPGALAIHTFIQHYPNLEEIRCWTIMSTWDIEDMKIEKWMSLKVQLSFFRNLKKCFPAAVAEVFSKPSTHRIGLYQTKGFSLKFSDFELFDAKEVFHLQLLYLYLSSILNDAYLNIEKFCELINKVQKRESFLAKVKELTPPHFLPEFLFIYLYYRRTPGRYTELVNQHYKEIYEIATRFPDGRGIGVIGWLFEHGYECPSKLLDICLQLNQKTLITFFHTNNQQVTFQNCKEAVLKGDYTLVRVLLKLFDELPSDRNDKTLYHFALTIENEALFLLILGIDNSGDELVRDIEGVSVLDWTRNHNLSLYRKIIDRFPRINGKKRPRRAKKD